MTTFALIGVGGYVAPRHMKAIKAVGGDLAVAFDPKDSVGVIDGYFPEAYFFVEFERFDRHIDKMKRRGQKLDYVSICSPNYLHDAHCRFALRSGADAICEKPLVLNPWNIEGLYEVERETGRKISTQDDPRVRLLSGFGQVIDSAQQGGEWRAAVRNERPGGFSECHWTVRGDQLTIARKDSSGPFLRKTEQNSTLDLRRKAKEVSARAE